MTSSKTFYLAAVALAASVLTFGVACGGNGSRPSETPGTTTAPQKADESDKPLFESNVKYEALDGMIARGAVAPFIDNFSCRWRSATVADCMGTGYDNAAEQSECGYALLPCGNFDLTVHAECADGSGHDCQIELNLIPHG